MKLLLVFAAASILVMVYADHDSCGGICCPPPCKCKCTGERVTTTGCECMELTFMVDASGSIGPLAWAITQQFLADIVVAFDDIDPLCPNAVKVAPITFGKNASLHWHFDSPENIDTATTVANLMGIAQARGQTNLVEGMEVAINQVYGQIDKSECSNIGIIITDGKANRRLSELASMSATLRGMLNDLVCIGVTNNIDMAQLSIVCPDPSRRIDVLGFSTILDIGMTFLMGVMAGRTTPEAVECDCCCPPPWAWGEVR